jgi:hypothetical protein
MFEKIYLIDNPLNNSKDWVSEREFKIGSEKLKNVFGILYLKDLTIMLHYNLPFKDAIMKKYKLLSDKNISLGHVCRLIGKDELDDLIDGEDHTEISGVKSIFPDYPSSIELKDGYYDWDEEKGCYAEAVNVQV